MYVNSCQTDVFVLYTGVLEELALWVSTEVRNQCKDLPNVRGV